MSKPDDSGHKRINWGKLPDWGGLATALVALAISGISLWQSQGVQNKADAQAQAAQANLVVTGLYPATPTKTGQGRVMVQNFSKLPISAMSIIGRDHIESIATLPACSEIDITGVAQTPKAPADSVYGVPLIAGAPGVGLQFIDASGLAWSRLGGKAPHRGGLSADEEAQIGPPSNRQGVPQGVLVSATPMNSCG